MSSVLQHTRFTRHSFFWIPFILAILDLTYFVTVPALVFCIVSPEPSVFWQQVVFSTSQGISVSPETFALSIIIIISMLRIGSIYLLKHRFGESLSNAYTTMTMSFLSGYMDALGQLKSVDTARFRKVLNAETNNLFFGVVVSTAFAVSEIFVIVTAICVVVHVFGMSTLAILLPLVCVLGAFLLFVKKNSHTIGSQRSESEQTRLVQVETLMQSGFSILQNQGGQYFSQQLQKVTKQFSSALSLQLVYPFLTKSVVDALLIVVLVFIVFHSHGVISASESALLVGVGFRAIPAFSRLSSYLETIRINKVGASDASQAIEHLEQSPPCVDANEQVISALQSVDSNGVYIVQGPSGIGKTTSIKHWLNSLTDKDVAYFDQNGFASASTTDELKGYLGVDSAIDLQDIDFLQGRKYPSLETLSGGEARLLQLLLLFTKPVDVFVLDEPSVGLDAVRKQTLQKLIVANSSHAAVVIVSHDTPWVQSLMAESQGVLFEIQ